MKPIIGVTFIDCLFLTKIDPMHTIRKAVSGSGERYLKMVNFPMNYGKYVELIQIYPYCFILRITRGTDKKVMLEM
ncbi:hypothetical protein T08_11871 [Trichinella sp. T8]|nr:hypothetical protein T08_11871 [Trichinella sp. T8]